MVVGFDAGEGDPTIAEEFLEDILCGDDVVDDGPGGVDAGEEPLGFVIWSGVIDEEGLEWQASHEVTGIALHDAQFSGDVFGDFTSAAVGGVVDG